MYRIMVVDDEPHIVHWISDLLTEHLSFETEVYMAYSAVEATVKLEKAYMDVVITDIRMPKMSGLELMDYINSRWGDTRIIFLTGYDEFDYVYKAISKEGVSYILKTEDDDVLLEAVEQAVQAIEERSQSILAANRQESLLRLLSYRDTVSGFVTGRLSFDYARERLADLAPCITAERDAFLMAARLGGAEENRFHHYAGIEMLMTEILSGKFHFLQVDYSENILIWLVQAPGNTPDSMTVYSLQDAADRIIQRCGQYWGLTVSFVIDPRKTSWRDIPNELLSLLYSDDFSGCTDGGTVVIAGENGLLAGATRQYADYSEKLRSMKLYLEQGKQEEYGAAFNELSAMLKLCPSMNDPYAAELYSHLSLLLLSYINKNGLHERMKLRDGAGLLANSTSFTHWQEATNYLEGLSRQVLKLQRQEIQQNRNSLVHSIEHYIENNIAGDLSLTAIGEALNYNPSYLSRIFKQITGTNLLKFIMEIKMKKAIHMLSQSTEPISSIGQSVGFNNSAYFAKVFRKYHGVNPQEYRDNSIRF